MTDIERYADGAMFKAAPMKSVTPQVHLLNMTADPLGAIAAACRMYEGVPTYSLNEVTDDDRRKYWDNMQRTHLLAPLEFVDLHFFMEGVDRAYTHQLVRQRTAVYAQESMRFAVKDNMAQEAAKPPSVSSAAPSIQQFWEETLVDIQDAYNFLVANGIPAEDARGILPHCVTTRIHYKTNLRNLVDHAGNRLCTQAQFVWRMVFAGIIDQINNYRPGFSWVINPHGAMAAEEEWLFKNGWQFKHIANSNMFRPICYQQGKCPVKADYDRGCTIRGRVDAYAAAGVPSAEWFTIRMEEWLLNPRAAWVTKGEDSGTSSPGRAQGSPSSQGPE